MAAPAPVYYVCPDCGTEYDGLSRAPKYSTPSARIPRRCESCRKLHTPAARGKAWRAKNADKIARYRMRRCHFTLEAWRAKCESRDWKCSFCGCQLDPHKAIRHKLNRSGPATLANTVPTCRSCHCKRAPRKLYGKRMKSSRAWLMYKAAGYSDREILSLHLASG